MNGLIGAVVTRRRYGGRSLLWKCLHSILVHLKRYFSEMAFRLHCFKVLRVALSMRNSIALLWLCAIRVTGSLFLKLAGLKLLTLILNVERAKKMVVIKV